MEKKIVMRSIQAVNDAGRPARFVASRDREGKTAERPREFGAAQVEEARALLNTMTGLQVVEFLVEHYNAPYGRAGIFGGGA